MRRLEGENLITLGACLAVAGLGAALYVPYEGDRFLRAQNLMQFVGALERNVAWPFFNAPAMACLILLPLIWLAVRYLRRDFPEGRAAEFILVLAGWGILQCLALAYGRGNFGEVVPASRFMDKLNVLAIASLFAWLALVRGWFPVAFLKRGAALLPLLWAPVIFLGLIRVSGLVVTDLLVPTRSMNLVAEERVAAFMASGNERDLLEPPTVPPDPRVVLGALRDKICRPSCRRRACRRHRQTSRVSPDGAARQHRPTGSRRHRQTSRADSPAFRNGCCDTPRS